jgi:hypothetical protein
MTDTESLDQEPNELEVTEARISIKTENLSLSYAGNLAKMN